MSSVNRVLIGDYAHNIGRRSALLPKISRTVKGKKCFQLVASAQNRYRLCQGGNAIRRYSAQLGLILMLASTALAQTPPVGGNLNEIIAGAKREGTINLVWSQAVMGEERQVQQHMANFNKLFGTSLNYRFSPGPSMPQQGNQLFMEYRAGQPASTDVFLAAILAISPFLQHGMYLTVPWTKLAPGRISANIVEGGGTLVRVVTSVSVVTYNTKLMPRPPASLEGLLAPEWKGRIATTPYAAGFDVLLANDFWGEKKTIDFAKRFSQQVAGLIRCGEAERILSGEYAALAIDCTSQSPQRWKERGAPIDFFVPSDAAQKRYYYVTVPKHASHPNAGVLFSLYLLSAEGQKEMWDSMRTDLDTLPGSHIGEVVGKYETQGVRFKDITAEWWAKHPEIHERLKQVTGIFSASK